MRYCLSCITHDIIIFTTFAISYAKFKPHWNESYTEKCNPFDTLQHHVNSQAINDFAENRGRPYYK